MTQINAGINSEFTDDKKREPVKNSRLVNIPNAWSLLKKLEWMRPVIYILLNALFFGYIFSRFVLKVRIDLSLYDVLAFIHNYLSPLFFTIVVFYLFILIKYSNNFIKNFLSLKIYFWVYIIIVIPNVFFFFKELIDIPSIIIDFISVLITLLYIAFIVSQFKASFTLIKVKNDIVGGLNTIGKALLVFCFVDVVWWVFFLITDESSSFMFTLQYIDYLIATSYLLVIIPLIHITILDAIVHNRRIKKSYEKNDEKQSF